MPAVQHSIKTNYLQAKLATIVSLECQLTRHVITIISTKIRIKLCLALCTYHRRHRGRSDTHKKCTMPLHTLKQASRTVSLIPSAILIKMNTHAQPFSRTVITSRKHRHLKIMRLTRACSWATTRSKITVFCYKVRL